MKKSSSGIREVGRRRIWLCGSSSRARVPWVSAALTAGCAAGVLLFMTVACGRPGPLDHDGAGLTVGGLLTDATGAPVGGARVAIERTGDDATVSVVEVAGDGSYHATILDRGYYDIRFEAKEKGNRTIRFWVESTGEVDTVLDVCLDDFRFADDPEKIVAIGDFNDFDFSSSVPLVDLGDGRWSAEIESEAESIEYQLWGLDVYYRTLYHGNQNEGIRYRDGRGWVGVAPVVDGRALISFTLGTGQARQCEAPFVFEASSSPEAVFARADFELRNAYSKTLVEMGEIDDPKDYPAAWAKFTRETLNPLYLEYSERLTDPKHADYLAALYLQFATLDKKFPDVATRAFDQLTPTSEALSAVWGWMWKVLLQGPEFWPDRAEGFIDELLDEHESEKLKTLVMENSVAAAKLAGDEGRATEMMSRLFENYPESDSASRIRQSWGDLSPIPAGSSAPDFEVVSLHEPDQYIRRADLEDGPYLIDFWATWCGPCIKEMPHLHKAYERYADRGLKILSISVDEDRSAAEAFVGTKFEMPWLHAIDTAGVKGEMPTVYGVQGIPAPVLVNSEGIIVAKSFELYGENLEKQLAKLFDGG